MVLARTFEDYMAVHSQYGEAYGTGTEIWGLCSNAHSQSGKSNGTCKI